MLFCNKLINSQLEFVVNVGETELIGLRPSENQSLHKWPVFLHHVV